MVTETCLCVQSPAKVYQSYKHVFPQHILKALKEQLLFLYIQPMMQVFLL